MSAAQREKIRQALLAEPGPMKRCPSCEQMKDRDTEFGKRGNRVTSKSHCKTCEASGQARRYRSLAPDAATRLQRDKALARMHGLTTSDYERLLDAQGGRCAICGTTDPGRRNTSNFAIDHDHTTGEVRGLLCNGCNMGIGHLRDDPEILREAIAYLQRPGVGLISRPTMPSGVKKLEKARSKRLTA